MAPRYTAFEGTDILARGALKTVIGKTRARLQAEPAAPILLFDDGTGRQTDIDFRGSVAEICARITDPPAQPVPASRGKGRPRLGVVAKEVTLMPRHWAWLRAQPGGASAALRRLVDEARRVQSSGDEVQLAQNATYAFTAAMAGNLPGFEEATRALFAGDRVRFEEQVAAWPEAVRDYALGLAGAAFSRHKGCLDGKTSKLDSQ